MRPGPHTTLVDIERCESREDADALRGVELCVPRDELPELDDDEFYFADLIGATVLVDDTPIGTVSRLLEYPSSECLEVTTTDGIIELPLLERWLVSVDVASKTVHAQNVDELPVQKK
ncbi:MAG: ribosome maturation factor RimM [Polyangiales bacterium]